MRRDEKNSNKMLEGRRPCVLCVRLCESLAPRLARFLPISCPAGNGRSDGDDDRTMILLTLFGSDGRSSR